MEIYQENIKQYNAQLSRLKKVLNRISTLRLLIFMISLSIIITLLSINLIKPVFIVLSVSVFCFALVVKYYNKIAHLKKHKTFLKNINESEILRLGCNLEKFNPGDKFINQNHPYTSDLDIFGLHSIFQLINRTTTQSGMVLLSVWLSEAAPNDEIRNRQSAIKELSKKLNWRQDFQASGMHFENKKSDYKKLLSWIEKPVVLLKYRRIYIAVAIVLSVALFLSFYLFLTNLNSLTGYIYLAILFCVLITNYIIITKLNPLAEEIVQTSQENLNTLKGYRTLINKIENESFESDKLQHLRSLLIKDNYSAYLEINTLCRLLDFSFQKNIKKIPTSGNQLYPILNNLLLLDIYLVIGIEKWKSKNRTNLKPWSKVVSEFEVLNSLAGFCYSNPTYTFPKLEDKNNYIHFESLGHPLINSDKRVCNDFHSEGHGDIAMVTGSNMGGKSTFLRTVGVNIVLALAGAPCCAKNGQVSNVKLFTSMRTQDNLKNGISSFYAELDRIEKMLKLVTDNHNVYFLLDEMFKGTNSEDRHKGGFSLINQISKLKTSGIIATHDIELAKLSENKKLVNNYSFNSEIKGSSMIFNYKLHKEICNDFNASELMRRSGIKVLTGISDEKG